MTDKELLKKFNEFLEENKTNFVNQINKEDKNLILDFIFYVVLKAERKEIIEIIEIKKMEALKYPLQVLDKKIYKLDNYNAGYDKAMQDIIKSLK